MVELDISKTTLKPRTRKNVEPTIWSIQEEDRERRMLRESKQQVGCNAGDYGG